MIREKAEEPGVDPSDDNRNHNQPYRLSDADKQIIIFFILVFIIGGFFVAAIFNELFL